MLTCTTCTCGFLGSFPGSFPIAMIPAIGVKTTGSGISLTGCSYCQDIH